MDFILSFMVKVTTTAAATTMAKATAVIATSLYGEPTDLKERKKHLYQQNAQMERRKTMQGGMTCMKT